MQSAAGEARSLLRSNESCSSTVRIFKSTWDSIDVHVSLSSWWANLEAELLRNNGVRRRKSEGLLGSQFQMFLNKPVRVVSFALSELAAGILYTWSNFTEEKGWKVGKIYLQIVWDKLSTLSLLGKNLRIIVKAIELKSFTSAIVTSLSFSSMLFVVSFVTKFPIFKQFL